MNGLFHAHSGLRYLILLVGAVFLVVLVAGLATKRPFSKLHRILGAAFAGLLHVQVVVGIALVALGRYYPQLIGHMVLMVLAAGAAQALFSINRRRPQPGLVLPLAGVVLSLGLIAAGVMAINRGLFTATAFQ